MSKFEKIDLKLVKLANRLNAKLVKDRPTYPEFLRTFEERRIDWKDKGICKAIIIQPKFEHKGVNSKKWNFINLAWYDDGQTSNRPQWMKTLIEDQKFEVIESQIDTLIKDSYLNLTSIKFEDLE